MLLVAEKLPQVRAIQLRWLTVGIALLMILSIDVSIGEVKEQAKRPPPTGSVGEEMPVKLREKTDQNATAKSRFPAIRALDVPGLEVVASLDVRPIGIAMSRDGRLFVSVSTHLGDPHAENGAPVLEVEPDGSVHPFPRQWYIEGKLPLESLSNVLALASDSRGILWILDSGGAPTAQPKLVGWDLKKEGVYRLVYLPSPITKSNSLLVSVSIDEKTDMAFIADQGRNDFVGRSESALISVNLKTGVAWRALEDHYSLNADGGDFVIKGDPLMVPDKKGGVVRPGLGVVAVAMDKSADWVYFGAANGRSIFRVLADDLSNPELSSAQVGERVHRFGDKPPSQGIFVIGPDRLLISDVNNNALGVTSKTGRYEVIASSEGLSWPSAFARGEKGEFYVVNSQFHRAPLFHRGEDKSQRPFSIVRFSLDLSQ